MTPEESTFFRLLDGYARTRHQCFLAEMDLRTEALGYFVCFRPLRISDDAIKNLRSSSSENLKKNLSPFYACKYLLVPTEYVRAAGSQQQLPASLVDQLDAELSQFKRVV